jgi:NAD(P)H-nitrite reductase large subunit
VDKSAHLVIIGNGITGITCAREVRKRSDCRITVISEESDYFFSRPALMYAFMGHMKPTQMQPYEVWFWEKNRIELMRRHAEKIDVASKTVLFSDNTLLSYDKLVLATGSQSNRFGWPGQDLPGVQGFYSMQDLEQLEIEAKTARNAVIVGGGLIGVEVAEMLLSRGITVDFLIREPNFWNIVLPLEEALLIEKHMRVHHVRLHMNTELDSIEPGPAGRVAAAVTKTGQTIPCEIVALTAGVSPNIDLAKASSIETGRGILINRRFETATADIFAAGDCAEFREAIPGRRAIEQVWYTGKHHAETLARVLCDEEMSYSPGTWFNSAKFFDLEYQIYGDVPATVPDNQDTFYWEHESGKKCLRINARKDNNAVVGIHAIGIRLRQNVCHKWIESRTPLAEVLPNLAKANFDPEFFKRHEDEIAASIQAQIKGLEKGNLTHV